MKQVVYTGTADYQIFEAADFKKADVDAKKTTFPAGEAVEVPDEVFDALVAEDGIFGGHLFAEANEKNSTGFKVEEKGTEDGETAKVDPETTSETATPQLGATSSAGKGTKGKGSST